MIQRYAQFWFLEKGLGIFLYHILCMIFFLMLCSINWPNFIVWLSLLLQILGNMCIAIVCFPSCNRFSTWPKSQDKNLNILRTKKRDFKVKLKAFFIIFKGLSVAKNSIRPESALLTKLFMKCYAMTEIRFLLLIYFAINFSWLTSFEYWTKHLPLIPSKHTENLEKWLIKLPPDMQEITSSWNSWRLQICKHLSVFI